MDQLAPECIICDQPSTIVVIPMCNHTMCAKCFVFIIGWRNPLPSFMELLPDAEGFWHDPCWSKHAFIEPTAFGGKPLYRQLQSMTEIACTLCKPESSFQTCRALGEHLKTDHQQRLCLLCLKTEIEALPPQSPKGSTTGTNVAKQQHHRSAHSVCDEGACKHLTMVFVSAQQLQEHHLLQHARGDLSNVHDTSSSSHRRGAASEAAFLDEVPPGRAQDVRTSSVTADAAHAFEGWVPFASDTFAEGSAAPPQASFESGAQQEQTSENLAATAPRGPTPSRHLPHDIARSRSRDRVLSDQASNVTAGQPNAASRKSPRATPSAARHQAIAESVVRRRTATNGDRPQLRSGEGPGHSSKGEQGSSSHNKRDGASPSAERVVIIATGSH
ncbi:hypothetical protein WJX82_009555 [Trebouxia sp. C0006]